MQEIAVLLISVCIIGFSKALKDPKCDRFPSTLDLHKCCYQIEMSSLDVAFNDCFNKYKNMPRPDHCAISCALNKTGITNPDGSMNFDVYNNYLVDQIGDALLVDYMMNIVHECEIKIVELLRNHQYNTDDFTWCQRGNLIRRCGASHGILHCPDQKRLKGNGYCDKIREDMEFCVGPGNTRGKMHVDISVFLDDNTGISVNE